MIMTSSIKMFREKLKDLSREKLLEIIKEQDIKYIQQINRIEYVFRNKLRNLTWEDGTPIRGRPFTKSELILLIDPPFIFDPVLARDGFNEEQQKMIHVASDPVLWAKYFLKSYPRVYQCLVLRDPSARIVMRFGRRAGKTATMAFFCLWYSYTHNDGRIVVVAPMKTHVGLIYEEILKLAKENDLILSVDGNGAIIKHIISPQYQITFKNESTIKFFTTGMKSNGRADVVRGQDAQVLILDEMDYMGPDDTVALMAMLMGTDENAVEDKRVFAASTPTGQRNKFYDWCTDKTGEYKSFWYPSFVNPAFKKGDEAQLHIDYPKEMDFRHEVLADWGEDVEGVYPHRFVNISQQAPGWEYVADKTSARSQYVFGVDWDKYKAGVNIVVLEMCSPNYEVEEWQNKIRLIYREEVSKGEFTNLAAVERIQELNHIFNPKWIYVDRGYGEVQVEMLHMYGMEHPETGLHKKVKGYQFSESIEMRDPWSKQPVKKEIKNFMVDNLYKYLEEERFIFPEQDEDLYLTLISYIVDRKSVYGKPIFAAGGQTTDHVHDALILACFAIADNFDDLLNPSFATKAVIVNNDAFLPTFELTTEKDKEIAEDKWGKGKGPIVYSRPMAYGVRRKSRTMTRKMF